MIQKIQMYAADFVVLLVSYKNVATPSFITGSIG